ATRASSMLTRTFSVTRSATTTASPLSLHDALPICSLSASSRKGALHAPSHSLDLIPDDDCARHARHRPCPRECSGKLRRSKSLRSEEHTSELQSRENLVCRLLLEKKKSEPIRIY